MLVMWSARRSDVFYSSTHILECCKLLSRGGLAAICCCTDLCQRLSWCTPAAVCGLESRVVRGSGCCGLGCAEPVMSWTEGKALCGYCCGQGRFLYHAVVGKAGVQSPGSCVGV